MAEGVETRRGADQVDTLDCGILQGYPMGRPPPVGRLATWPASTLAA